MKGKVEVSKLYALIRAGIFKYSRTSVARTGLGPWKVVPVKVVQANQGKFLYL